ncbi:MAG: 5'/3'-nucleotidase SurE [Desulfobacterales bacterium]|nr:5'/3'-nucleotidase SurE [Desulfobacterales bacterium]
MNILMTNDDGIYAPGLWAVYRQLMLKHALTVVAPDRERSAVGHGITLNEPLRLEKVMVNGGFQGYAVSGTPADCIRLGILEILDAKPDLAVSGINPGINVGININYSGTVAAAREAALYGIPAIALSIQGREARHFEAAARVAEVLAEFIFRNGLPHGTILNVNIPDVTTRKIAGVKISRQGIPTFSDYFDKRVDPRNKTYYWQGSEFQAVFSEPDMDGAALENDYISITPIQCDMTDYATMDNLKSWDIEKKVLNNEKTVYKRS